MTRRAGRAAAAGLSILALAACSGRPRLEAPGQVERDWSTEAGSLRLERVIGTRRDLGGGRGFGWLSEKRDTRLFRRPYGIAWAGEDLILTDPAAGSVVRVDSQGKLTRSPQGAFESPIGVAVCSLGIVVSDSRRGTLELLDPALRPLRTIAAELDRPTGVECNGERLFVAETGRHRVLVFAPQPTAGASEMLEIWGGRGSGDGQFNFPTALALGERSLWVADTLNFRVQRLNPDTGAFLGTWGSLGDAVGELPRIKDLAIGPDGRLWLSDAYLDQVAVFDGQGVFLLAVGSPGVGPGQFAFPAGLAAHPDGRIAMVDSLNRRLQIFRWVPARPTSAPVGDRGEGGAGN
jgi:hypothetical protein